MFLGAIIMGVTGLITFILLPKQVHVLQEQLDITRSLPLDETLAQAAVSIPDE